jgi:murein DD-endopeptidase MepM/ murein hydrolase activator NlpD
MGKDHLTILLFTPRSRRTKSLSVKVSHIKLAFFTLIGFIIAFLSSSFMFNYSFYKKAIQKREQINQLVGKINVLNEDLNRNEAIKESLRGRLEDIEEKLLEMQKLLGKKGIEKELVVGGEFIPADRYSLSYLDFMEQDIDGLFDVLESVPVGTPLSGKINSGFGYRRDPFNSRLALHSGVDIEAKSQQPVIATADGTVKHAGWYKGYGKTVIIKHKHGYKTLYGHLSRVDVNKDQRVKSGDIIGHAGSTGRSTGTHLHYEVIIGGKNINPMRYLSLR